MKPAIYIIALLSSLIFGSCSSVPTLQKYFVENSDNKDFIAFDLSSDILNSDNAKLTTAQKEALKSFEKINVLAFKLNNSNNGRFEKERAEVDMILKDPSYQKLMNLGFGGQGASVSYVEKDGHINEFVFFVKQNNLGFAVIRVLGKDMNPASILSIISVLKSSNIDLEQLKQLRDLMKK